MVRLGVVYALKLPQKLRLDNIYILNICNVHMALCTGVSVNA